MIKLKPHVGYFNKKNLCTFLYFKDKQFFIIADLEHTKNDFVRPMT